MKRTLLLLALLVVLAPPLAAADRWTYVRSEHFTLAGSADEETIRSVAANLELLRAVFSQVLFPLRGESADMRVIVFRTNAEFQSYKPPTSAPNTAAYFLLHEDLRHIVLSAQTLDQRVVSHEYVHALVADSLGRLPPWFNEGIAEFLSTFAISGNSFQIGRPIPPHLRSLQERGTLPLEQLWTVSPTTLNNDLNQINLFYAESWLTVHYLFLGEERRHQGKLPQLIAQWQRGVPVSETLDDIELTPATLARKLGAYFDRNNTLPVMTATLKGQLDAQKRASSRLATEGEAEAYRGDLLVRLNRATEAEPHLRQAVVLSETFGPAHVSLASLLLRQGKTAEAVPHLKRAIELDPRDHRAHYYYAAALRRLDDSSPTGKLDTLAQAEAREAVKLSPQFVNAIKLLTNINLSLNEDLESTKSMLRQALQDFPSDLSLATLTGTVLFRTGDKDGAKEIADYLEARTTDPATINAALTLRRAAQPVAKPPTVQIDAPPPVDPKRPTLRREAKPPVTESGPRRVGTFRYEIESSVAVKVATSSYPTFPESLFQAGKGAQIVFRITTGPDGRATSITVIDSTNPEITSLTVDTLRRWRFEPAGATMRLTFFYTVEP